EIEPCPEITRRRDAALEHNRGKRHWPCALYDAEVASAFLDHLRLHRRFQSSAFHERTFTDRARSAVVATRERMLGEVDVKAEHLVGIDHRWRRRHAAST